MLEKFKTIFWFLQRPNLYLQLFYLVKSRILDHKENEQREEAEAWCRIRAITAEESIKKITRAESILPIHEKFEEIFKDAHQKAQACPVAMGGPGDIDLLYYLCEHTKARKVIETGVAYGWSSLAILLSLCERKEHLLCSTDMPYAKMDNDSYVGCVVPDRLRLHWQLIRFPDQPGLPRALSITGEIDLCHYDSDKSYRGRQWAYPLLWDALKKEGIFISDDIGDNLAFKEFAERVGAEPVIIESDADPKVTKYVGILIKE